MFKVLGGVGFDSMFLEQCVEIEAGRDTEQSPQLECRDSVLPVGFKTYGLERRLRRVSSPPARVAGSLVAYIPRLILERAEARSLNCRF